MRKRPPAPPSDAPGAPDGLLQLAWYGQRKPVFTGGNQVRLLRGGLALFPALCEHIDQAQHSVWMASYMVSPEGLSATVLQALQRAAQRGVSVHLVVDAVGSDMAPSSLWRELSHAGVQVAQFRPLHRLWGLLEPSSWRRMHMKLCVVDAHTAFVGGINLIDDHQDLHHGWFSSPRLDYALHVQGPVVTPVEHTIQAMWTRARFGRDWREELMQWMQVPGRVERLRLLWLHARRRLSPKEQRHLNQGASLHKPMRAAFVLRDNLLQRRTIERATLRAIRRARHGIDIVTPYFYPRRAIRLALGQAAQRGVEVRLLLQGHADFRIAALAQQVLYAELQVCGVHIHEYQGALLHAKVLRVDDEWAMVGSSNLDPLSLVLNLEANLIVKDRAFVRTLSEQLDTDFASSQEVLARTQGPPGWDARWRRRSVAWLAKAYLWLSGNKGRY